MKLKWLLILLGLTYSIYYIHEVCRQVERKKCKDWARTQVGLTGDPCEGL
jgi:hypothetical protein